MDDTLVTSASGLASLQATWRRPSLLAVLIGNLVPAVCVLSFGWSAGVLLLLYWFENVVLGLINLLKMIVGAVARGEPGVLFAGPFFAVHYGIFCLGHLAFVILLFNSSFATDGALALDHPLAFARSVLDRYPGLPWNALLLAGAHLIGFAEWCLRRGWRGVTLGAQMAEPYSRIVVLHVTLIFGGWAVMASGQPAFAVLLLGLFKTFYDVRATAGRLVKADRRAAGTPLIVRAA